MVPDSMNPHTVVAGILSGLTLVIFGLVPGLLDTVVYAIRNFQNEISGQSHRVEPHPIQRPVSLAWMGAAVIAFVLLANALA